MNFIMIGLLIREALDRLRVRLNMYLVVFDNQCGVVFSFIRKNVDEQTRRRDKLDNKKQNMKKTKTVETEIARQLDQEEIKYILIDRF